MDPTALWKMLCEALREMEQSPDNRDLRAHSVDMLEVLARWLRMGGFPPTITGGDDGTLPGAGSRTH